MPSIFKMSTSDEKKTEASGDSTYVIAESAPAAKARPTKKYVIIAVSVVVTIAIVLTAIIVGMYMFTQAEQAVIQYTMNIGNGKQSVTSDPNQNVVQYHVSTSSGENWVVNDFNREIQMMKVTSTDGTTNCFLTPLNIAEALSPAQITGPESNEITSAVSMIYTPANTPVTDISFLSQTVQTMCSGLSVYWLYPECSTGAANNNMPPANQTSLPSKQKRQSCRAGYSDAPYYDLSYMQVSSTYCAVCFTGCCQQLCACSITYSSYISGGCMYCSWSYSKCSSYTTFTDVCVNGPQGLSCPTPANPPTC